MARTAVTIVAQKVDVPRAVKTLEDKTNDWLRTNPNAKIISVSHHVIAPEPGKITNESITASALIVYEV